MKKKLRPKKSKQARHGKVILMPSGYQGDVHRIVDQIFEEAASQEWSSTELANRAHLSHYTVWRLQSRITRYPRFDTIWKLCKATGFALGIVQKRKGATRTIRFSKVNFG